MEIKRLNAKIKRKDREIKKLKTELDANRCPICKAIGCMQDHGY